MKRRRLKNNIYTSLWSFNCTPGTHGFSTWFISVMRTMKIKSVLFDLSLIRIGAPAVAYNSHNYPQDQDFQLLIGYNGMTGTNKFASPMFFTAPPAPVNTGDYLILTRPQQVQFNSFFVSERLDFTFSANNYTAADIFQYNFTLAVETEENINY